MPEVYTPRDMLEFAKYCMVADKRMECVTFTIEHKRLLDGTKREYTHAWSDIPALPVEFDYALGDLPPRYPMPACRTDTLYWRMPSYPTNNLIAAWYLWKV